MLQDIAKDLGVTQARVSQICSEALTSLRAWFGTLYEGAPAVGDDDPDLALILHGDGLAPTLAKRG